MKHISLAALFLLAAAANAAPSSDFYKKFIDAAWQERHGNYAAARQEYAALNAEHPGTKTIVSSLANLAVMTDDKEAMAEFVPQLIKLAPKEARTIGLNAAWQWSQGNLTDAIKLYEQAISLEPDNAGFIQQYVTLLAGVDSERAVAYLKTLSGKYPALAGAIAIQIANLYLGGKDNQSAVDYLKQTQQKHPRLPEAYYGLVKIYESLGDTASALNEYLAMERAGLADADILTKIGAYYVLAKKQELGLQYFVKAKKLDNAHPLAAQFLALNAQEKGDWAAAIEYLTQSANYGADAALQVRVSYFYTRLGERQKAADVLKEIYDRECVKNLEAALYYSLALLDLRDYKQAAAVLQAVLAEHPQNELALLNYAFALEGQKKYKDMETALKQLLQVNPQSADALNFLGYHLVDKTRRYEEGGNYVKKAIALKPDNVAFIDSLAWYFYKTKDYPRAQALIESILPDAATDSELQLHAAKIYEAMGDWAQALEHYQTLQKLEPGNKEAAKGVKKMGKRLN